MRCKTCGSEISRNTGYCPNCGVTLHIPAKEQPVRMAKKIPPIGGESAHRQLPPLQKQNSIKPQPKTSPQKKAAPAPHSAYPQYTASNPKQPVVRTAPQHKTTNVQKKHFDVRCYIPILTGIILLIASLGTLFCDFLKLRYSGMADGVYAGMNFSMGFSNLFDVGLGKFFRGNDALSNVTMIIVALMLPLSLTAMVLSAVKGFKGRLAASERFISAGFIAPLISYLMTFADAVYIRSTYLDDGFSSGKCLLTASPLLMAILCVAVGVSAFLASNLLKNKN